MQIYWTKGFLYGGKVLPFNINLGWLTPQIKGLGFYSKLRIIRRFELTSTFYDPKNTLAVLDKESRKSLNRIFSQMASVNYQINEVTRVNIIRLFLIKSFRGKAQAFGKPSRGQRTWSNAWTSYLYNKELRVFIAVVQRQINQNKKEEKINYKLLKKKTLHNNNDLKPKKEKKKRSSWF